MFVHQREQETGGVAQWEILRHGDTRHLAGFAHTVQSVLFFHVSAFSEKLLWHRLRNSCLSAKIQNTGICPKVK